MSGTVVLCGSLGSTAAMWDGQLSALGDRRVLRVEHPGHDGASVTNVEDVGDLARRVLDDVSKGESFSFVGLSLGAAVGLQLALDAPERIERLVLASASARFGEPEQWLDRAATVRARGLGSIVDAVIARWFTPAFGDANGFRDMFLSTDREGYARCCEALARWDVREELGRIAAPTLVITGMEDPSTPPAEGELITSLILDARLALIDGAAHLANVERADEFNRLLEEHL
jgi:3-oxoadipate enol-lactonase